MELKARFDESANIRWAKKLEQAGVHVVYGIPSLKTHVKCVLVVRREGDGVRHYVHIGTGNYNPKTARIYTDLGLFTADPEIGADIAEMFNSLTGYARPRRYRTVLVAPFNLQKGLLEEVERTIEAHSPSKPARIRMKMNSLLDPICIRALYRASQAGVDVQLNTRGICALRPGVPEVSENVHVVSVVGRFLEHSRIYSFERPDEPPSVYIGSADLMPRNLYNRVELVTPVRDPKLGADLCDVLDRSFADNTNAWDLASEGEWTRRQPDGEPRNVQRRAARSPRRQSRLGRQERDRAEDHLVTGLPTRDTGTSATLRRVAERHTTRGYWLEEAGAVEPAPALAADESADVVVVGGGYTGMWAAWHAKRLEPEARVLLVESAVCGEGPSGRNGGFVNTLWFSLPNLRRRFGDRAAVAVARAAHASVGEIGAFCNEQPCRRLVSSRRVPAGLDRGGLGRAVERGACRLPGAR